MAWRDRNSEADGEEAAGETADGGVPGLSEHGVTAYLRAAGSAFWVIFIAEWGDLTQLATASLAAHNPHDLVTIFTAACLALWSVTALVVFLGSRIRGRIPVKLLHQLTAVIFAAIGVYFIVT
jgi:putative Ca2+/H+ antiporter (TMEM165/GDT1 family)